MKNQSCLGPLWNDGEPFLSLSLLSPNLFTSGHGPHGHAYEYYIDLLGSRLDCKTQHWHRPTSSCASGWTAPWCGGRGVNRFYLNSNDRNPWMPLPLWATFSPTQTVDLGVRHASGISRSFGRPRKRCCTGSCPCRTSMGIRGRALVWQSKSKRHQVFYKLYDI